MLSEPELKAIEDRANAATEGPWMWRDTNLTDKRVTFPHLDHVRLGNNRGHRVLMADKMMRGDADFIAFARTDVLVLLDEVRRLQAKIERDAGACPVDLDQAIADEVILDIVRGRGGREDAAGVWAELHQRDRRIEQFMVANVFRLLARRGKAKCKGRGLNPVLTLLER